MKVHQKYTQKHTHLNIIVILLPLKNLANTLKIPQVETKQQKNKEIFLEMFLAEPHMP